MHLQQLENEKQTKPKISRRKEIIKIRVEIKEIEMKKAIENVKETKSWFLVKINKSGKPLAKLIKKKRKTAQINKMKKEKLQLTS